MSPEYFLPRYEDFYKILTDISFIDNINHNDVTFYIKDKKDINKYKKIFDKSNFFITNKDYIDYIFFVELSKNKKYNVISDILDRYIIKLSNYMANKYYSTDFLKDNLRYFLNQDILNLNKQIKLDINLKMYYILYMFKNFDFVNIDNIDNAIKEFRENKFIKNKVDYDYVLSIKKSFLDILEGRLQEYINIIFNKYDNIKSINIKFKELKYNTYNYFIINLCIKKGNNDITLDKLMDIKDKLESFFNYFKLEYNITKYLLNDIEFFNQVFNNIDDYLLNKYLDNSYINIEFTDMLKTIYETYKLADFREKNNYIIEMKKISKKNIQNILFYLCE